MTSKKLFKEGDKKGVCIEFLKSNSSVLKLSYKLFITQRVVGGLKKCLNFMYLPKKP